MKFAVATNTYFVKSLECLKREKGRKSLKLNVSTTGNQLQHDRERENWSGPSPKSTFGLECKPNYIRVGHMT